MSTGWIKLHRELLDKPIWESSTPEQKVILVTLLAMANHAEKEWEFGGEKYKAMPGQFVTSLPSIAKKAGNGISIQNVRTALLRFEKYDFLTCKSTNKNRLVTIVNWGVYQQKENDLTGKLTGDQQATNRQLTANKNVKNEKNEKKSDSVHSDELFDQWWELYSNKKGRAKCVVKYNSLLKKHNHEKMMSGTKEYINHRRDLIKKGEFCPQQKNPLTFLNGEHFSDEYEFGNAATPQAPKAFKLVMEDD